MFYYILFYYIYYSVTVYYFILYYIIFYCIYYSVSNESVESGIKFKHFLGLESPGCHEELSR